MNPILRTKLLLFTLLPLCFSCAKHVCPTYLSSFDVSRRAIESFFSYYNLDSLDPIGSLKKTREGFVIFHRPDEFKTYSTWAEDSIGWAGIINDTASATAENFKFKSGGIQSRFAAKRKPADHLFKSYPQTFVLTGSQKLGIFSKIFKSRPQNFNRYVKAKLRWAKPQGADSAEQDTTPIMDATVEDLKFQAKKEPKKSLASSEQLFYDLHVVPMLPNFDSLINADTAQVVVDSLGTERPKRWWQFWKKKKKVITDLQVEEETSEEALDDEILVIGEDFAAPDPPEKRKSANKEAKASKKKKPEKDDEEPESDDPQTEDSESLPKKKKVKPPKKKKKAKGEIPPEDEEQPSKEDE